MIQIQCLQKSHKGFNCEWVCLEKDCQVSRFLCKYCILDQTKQNNHQNVNLIFQKQQVDLEIENIKDLHNDLKKQIDTLKYLLESIKKLIVEMEKLIYFIQIKCDSFNYFNIQSRDDYNQILNFFSNNLEDRKLNYDCKELKDLKLLSIIRKKFPLDEMVNQIESLINYIATNFIDNKNKSKIKIIEVNQMDFYQQQLLKKNESFIYNSKDNQKYIGQVQDGINQFNQDHLQNQMSQYDGIILNDQDIDILDKDSYIQEQSVGAFLKNFK